MAAEDWFVDEGDDFEQPSRCKYCDQQILWESDKAYQYSTGKPHLCRKTPRVASAEEFPVV